MNDIIQLIREWTPTLAVLAGGIWILIKWSHGEIIRLKRDVTSLDGDLNHVVFHYNDHNKLIALEAYWNNKGSLPIKIDTKKTKIDIYAIPENLEEGYIDISKIIEKPEISIKPFIDDEYLIIEPNTESLFRTHLLLNSDKIYIVQWHLVGDRKMEYWFKEKVIDLKNNIEQTVQH